MASGEEALTAIPAFPVSWRQGPVQTAPDPWAERLGVESRPRAYPSLRFLTWEHTGRTGSDSKIVLLTKGLRLGIRTSMSKSGFTWDKNLRD